eukprot:7231862-Pyramimonas_sp.AAC.1
MIGGRGGGTIGDRGGRSENRGPQWRRRAKRNRPLQKVARRRGGSDSPAARPRIFCVRISDQRLLEIDSPYIQE